MYAHGYRLVMRGSLYGSTASTNVDQQKRHRDLESGTRREERRGASGRTERRTNWTLGCTVRAMTRVSLMAKRRYTMADVSNHIKQ